MKPIIRSECRDSPTPAEGDRTRLSAAPLADRGWNLDSIAHFVLLGPVVVGTIVSLATFDWSAFNVV